MPFACYGSAVGSY